METVLEDAAQAGRLTSGRFAAPERFGCASFTWVTSCRPAVGLGPEAVPAFAAADVQGAQRRHGCRAVLDPAHPRPLQAFADDFAVRFGRAAASVPALVPLGRVVGARPVVLEITDELAQVLTHFARRSRPRGETAARLIGARFLGFSNHFAWSLPGVGEGHLRLVGAVLIMPGKCPVFPGIFQPGISAQTTQEKGLATKLGGAKLDTPRVVS